LDLRTKISFLDRASSVLRCTGVSESTYEEEDTCVSYEEEDTCVKVVQAYSVLRCAGVSVHISIAMRRRIHLRFRV
jgi:hypothetical protein